MNAPDEQPQSLTAWALDELSPERRQEIDALLAEDPKALQQAEATRDFCALLDRHLRKPEAALEEAQRARILHPSMEFPEKDATASDKSPSNATSPSPRVVVPFWKRPSPWLGAIAAAGVAVFAVLQRPRLVIEPPDHSSPVTAREPSAPRAASASTPSPATSEASDGTSSPARRRGYMQVPVSEARSKSAEVVTAPTGLTTGGLRLDYGIPLPAGAEGEGRFEFRPEPETAFTRTAEQLTGSETYAQLPQNSFFAPAQAPLSTFSIDVDTAAYANVRRFLNQGQRPPVEAVRLEELVNYFSYNYPQPVEGKPFSVTVDFTETPWNLAHRLARIGLKGREIATDQRPASNLVFLVDVSGSMDAPNKLPLVRQSLGLLLEKLGENDRVGIVTYAGQSRVALQSLNGTSKSAIKTAVDELQPGGSTNGASGIQLAYQMAQEHFIKGGVNRVILATDGDFNVGITSQTDLQNLITERARGGVFLSVLGYGMGNLKDSTMEMLADKGNGNYAYIDSLSEARKVLSEEMSGTLVTIAKDVKIQVEFNPAVVQAYRLLGYENRLLAKEDFNDDRKDAGEIGAGHTVTALYEIIPVGTPGPVPVVDGLKYQAQPVQAEAPKTSPASSETMTVKLRYKAPDGDVSQLIESGVTDKGQKLAEAPGDTKFASAVAGFALLLKNADIHGNLTWEQVRQLALAGKGEDKSGYRGEFLQLIDKAASSASIRF